MTFWCYICRALRHHVLVMERTKGYCSVCKSLNWVPADLPRDDD